MGFSGDDASQAAFAHAANNDEQESWLSKRLGDVGDTCDACDFITSPDCSSCGDLMPSCDSCDVPCFDCSLGMLTLMPLFRMAAPRPARPRGRTTAPGRAGLAAIRGYQRWISPRLPIRCRYTPSCSEYGAQAVRRYGLLAGSRMAAARISRCNHDVPYGTADPVESGRS